MENIKKIGLRILSVLVIIFGVYLMSYGLARAAWANNTEQDKFTWFFTGVDSNDDVDQASNYSLTRPTEFQCGGNSTIICSIQDVADPNQSDQPLLSHGAVSTDREDTYQKTFRVD